MFESKTDPSPRRASTVSRLKALNRPLIGGRLAGAIDLMVDFATLGEYGLEPLPADGRCGLDGQRAGWEALATSRRGSCGGTLRARSRVR